MAKENGVLYHGKVMDCPVVRGTAGSEAIDLTKLYPLHRLLSYDPSYNSTASCRSSITYIDGDRGHLAYRGYTVEDLCAGGSFLETAYLLFEGDLPTRTKLEDLKARIRSYSRLEDTVLAHIASFPRKTHPMAILLSVMAAMSGLHHHADDLKNPQRLQSVFCHVLAVVPMVIAAIYRHRRGEPLVCPAHCYGYVENFMHMMFSEPGNEELPRGEFIDALDQLLILHADHEQNASTSVVRNTASTGANPYACLAAGIAALWGPKHGGANEAVLHMLREEIKISDNIPSFLEKVKDKTNSSLLMGFGHRVYKNYDPRARIIQATAEKLFAKLRKQDSGSGALALALSLEEKALADPYFRDRKLYPNVDFYSGILYDAMGLPPSMFTIMFALSRVGGWMAHWRECTADPEQHIARPRQIYVGATQRPYVPLDRR